MDKSSYSFKNLESLYSNFMAPTFEIVIGNNVIDSTKIPISELTVEIDSGVSAGGCQFSFALQYNYETSTFASDIVKKIKVGDILSVKAGYIRMKEIFYGLVDSVTLSYQKEEKPTVEVTGIDAKAYLRSFRPQIYFNKKKANDIIKNILSQCISAGYAKKVTMGTLKPFESEIIVDKLDYAAFITEMAKLYGFQFFIVNGEIIFDDVYSDATSLITLELGTSLLEFTKICSLSNQVGAVNVYSTNPGTGKPISGKASKLTLPGGGKSAVETAKNFKSSYIDINNAFVKNESECNKLAQSILNERSMKYVTGTGSCIGLPELIPGRYITVEGLDDSCENKYFISKVTHRYTGGYGGYKTDFEIEGAKN